MFLLLNQQVFISYKAIPHQSCKVGCVTRPFLQIQAHLHCHNYGVLPIAKDGYVTAD